MSKCNPLILQSFEWHTTSGDESHYSHLINLLPTFAHLGVTSLWLPPGCKANNPRGNGYDIYDLWDLGEFEQKGSRGTKWGNREELNALLSRSKELKIDIIWDAVLNHKAGADATDEVWAVEVDKEDRRYEISPPKLIQAWLKFDFPGRRQTDGTLKYSEMKWRSDHFNGVDWDHRERKNVIFKLIDDPATLERPFIQPKRPAARAQTSRRRLSTLLRRFSSDSGKIIKADTGPVRRPGKGWNGDVDKENGNADYLMFSNIDYTNQEAQDEVKKWGEWMISEVGIQGFRLDAVQHYSFQFSKEWIRHVQNTYSHSNDIKDIFIVGEVWSGAVATITAWLDAVQQPSRRPQVYAYDAPLLYNFSRISEDILQRSKNVDLRTVLQGSLVATRPEASVTLVTNHDTQPGQTCHTPMWSRLKLLWYAFILLRKKGLPCVFWGDLFGMQGPHAEPSIELGGNGTHEEKNIMMSDMLARLMLCRKYFAFGEQRDYWQSTKLIGWTRADEGGNSGCAVILSASPGPKTASSIEMQIGLPGDVWLDIAGHSKDDVKTDAKGLGNFAAGPSGLSVWVKKGSEEMLDLPQQK